MPQLRLTVASSPGTPDGRGVDAELQHSVLKRRVALLAVSTSLIATGLLAGFLRAQPPKDSRDDVRTFAQQAHEAQALLEHRGHNAFRFVAWHNSSAAAVLETGLLTGGVTTALGLLVMPYASAAGIASEYHRGRLARKVVLAAVLPHGIIEFPAIALIGASGLSGFPIMLAAFHGQMLLASRLARSSGALFIAGLGGLLLAAGAEAFLTPMIVRKVIGL